MAEMKPGEVQKHVGTETPDAKGDRHMIPVWFFVGLVFVIYGVLILASGIEEWSHPPDTVLANLHAPVWWGALLVILGSVYVGMFRPKRGE